ncbi:MAG: hypothetical protein LBO82_00930 [Synergistaceae bacterium]|nr:hypothetical protein [Synergistaceae bacterium]
MGGNSQEKRRFRLKQDTAVSEEKKGREKFETRMEKAVNDLRGGMDARFEKIDARFGKLNE